MREKILTFIEKNSRINLKELAIMLGVDEASVANEIAAMEQENVICGYHTLIDWDRAGLEKVTAMIEVRVTPQRGMGFDKIAGSGAAADPAAMMSSMGVSADDLEAAGMGNMATMDVNAIVEETGAEAILSTLADLNYAQIIISFIIYPCPFIFLTE